MITNLQYLTFLSLTLKILTLDLSNSYLCVGLGFGKLCFEVDDLDGGRGLGLVLRFRLTTSHVSDGVLWKAK